jgi:hypothetical protein
MAAKPGDSDIAKQKGEKKKKKKKRICGNSTIIL